MVDALDSWIHPKGSGIRIRQTINTCGNDAYGTSYAVTVPNKIADGARKRKQFSEKCQAEQWAADQWKGVQKQGETYFEARNSERNEFANMLPRLREAGGDKTLHEIIEDLRACQLAPQAWPIARWQPCCRSKKRPIQKNVQTNCL